MQNKNSGEATNWKNKLEELDYIPDAESLNKNASWDKLQNRMQKKTKRTKVGWYWLAAASFIFIFISVALFFNREQTVTANILNSKNNMNPSPQNFKEKNISPIKEDIKKKETIVLVDDKMKIKQTSLPVNKKILDIVDALITNETAAANNINQQKILPKIITTNKTEIDSTAIVATGIIPQIKKLKVVHINELGIPEDEAAIIARNREIIFQKNKLYTRSIVSINNLYQQANSRKTILTINLNSPK